MTAFKSELREIRKRIILEALQNNNGNQILAAKSLKTHRNTLQRMMRELGIKNPFLRPGRKLGWNEVWPKKGLALKRLGNSSRAGKS